MAHIFHYTEHVLYYLQPWAAFIYFLLGNWKYFGWVATLLSCLIRVISLCFGFWSFTELSEVFQVNFDFCTQLYLFVISHWCLLWTLIVLFNSIMTICETYSMAGRQVFEVSPSSLGGSLYAVAVSSRGSDMQKVKKAAPLQYLIPCFISMLM